MKRTTTFDSSSSPNSLHVDERDERIFFRISTAGGSVELDASEEEALYDLLLERRLARLGGAS